MKVRQGLQFSGDSDGASAGSRGIDVVIERGFYDGVPNYRLKRVMLGYWGRGGDKVVNVTGRNVANRFFLRRVLQANSTVVGAVSCIRKS